MPSKRTDHCYRLLSQILGSAVDAGLIAASPCRNVRLPKDRREEMCFLDVEVIDRLAAAIEPYGLLVYCGAYLGLRWGEVAGLRRKHVNLLRSRIEVVEILTEVGGHVSFGAPKTKASVRNVAVPAS